MDEDTQDDLDAIRDYKETLERESGYEEDCDQQMYIQGVNKAISSVKKARLKEFRDTKRIQERIDAVKSMKMRKSVCECR